MKAFITGASSGIGLEMAKYLSTMGCDLILVARNKKKLLELKETLPVDAQIFSYDLSNISNCYKLYDEIKDKHIDIVINNAGYGLFGRHDEVNLDEELNMIDLNVKCLQIFTNKFLKNNDVKYILNVASSAGLTKGGPLMSTYYATKSYVCNYSLAIYEELRRMKSDKTISVLCPGPVDTNFNDRANVKFSVKQLTSAKVAKYAIDKMFKKKLIIIPGFSVQMGMFFMKFLPIKTLLKITYKLQERKKAS